MPTAGQAGPACARHAALITVLPMRLPWRQQIQSSRAMQSAAVYSARCCKQVSRGVGGTCVGEFSLTSGPASIERGRTWFSSPLKHWGGAEIASDSYCVGGGRGEAEIPSESADLISNSVSSR
jgi:hypothetical protein